MPGPKCPHALQPRPKMVRWPGQEQVHGPKQMPLLALTPQAPGSLPLSHASHHDTHKHVGVVMI